VGIDSFGNPRYRRAQFDILFWDSDSAGTEEQYINVPAQVQIDSTEINEAGRDFELGNFFGFYGGKRNLVDPSGNGDDETWLGLHSFGYY
jgi:hypothetical protein